MNKLFYITTSRNFSQDITARALRIAADYGLVFLERGKRNIGELISETGSSFVFTVENERILINFADGEKLFFHPGMAPVRMKTMRKGCSDVLISAGKIKPDDNMLDCTAGMGADSLVLGSYLDEGKLVALEKSFPAYVLLREGLRNARLYGKRIYNAALNINLLNFSHEEFFERNPDERFDIIYFDPMFYSPIMESSGIKTFRRIASKDILTPEYLSGVKEFANKRIIVKMNVRDLHLLRDSFDSIYGNSRNKIIYGVIENEEE